MVIHGFNGAWRMQSSMGTDLSWLSKQPISPLPIYSEEKLLLTRHYNKLPIRILYIPILFLWTDTYNSTTLAKLYTEVFLWGSPKPSVTAYHVPACLALTWWLLSVWLVAVLKSSVNTRWLIHRSLTRYLFSLSFCWPQRRSPVRTLNILNFKHV